MLLIAWFITLYILFFSRVGPKSYTNTSPYIVVWKQHYDKLYFILN